MPPKEDWEVAKLHDNSPRGVMMQYNVVAETATVKDFHVEPWHGEGNHNGTPQRITTPVGIAAAGAEVSGFRPKNPSSL